MNTEKIQAVQSSFEKLGIIAMHGGRKGNGFWLYLGTIGCGRALLNNGKAMGKLECDKTSYRVNFACQKILSGGQTTRNFDNCFENDDSHIVGGKVYARALKNPKLMESLPRYLDADMCKADHVKLMALKCALTA